MRYLPCIQRMSAFVISAGAMLFGCASGNDTGAKNTDATMSDGEEGTGTDDTDVNTELLSVIVVSRHGIRSQTVPLDTINQFTLRPQGFPVWPPQENVPDSPGTLSAHGFENAKRLGVWYRAYYADRGIWPPKGTCPRAGEVFVYADVFERTIQTAKGYAAGLFDDESMEACGIEVETSNDTDDPYFNPLAAGICKIDTATDEARLKEAMGGDPEAFTKTYAATFQKLQDVTQCCRPSVCATPEDTEPETCALSDLPSVVSADETTGAVEFGPLFGVADLLTETFELEYAQGMPMTDCATDEGAECTAWGAMSSADLQDLMKLHVEHFDLLYRLPSFAQSASSNLMNQIAGAMHQTVSGIPNPDILVPASNRFSLFVGHDVNITAVAGLLDVNWQAESFLKNDPSPAGALVFELHKKAQSEDLVVRLFFVTATLEQMRNGTKLSTSTPPQRIPLQIPACGVLDCPYDTFKALVEARLRSACITNAEKAA